MGKSHKLPSHTSISVYSPLELIFIDLWGPSHLTSYAGYKCYVSFIDAFSIGVEMSRAACRGPLAWPM